MIRRLFSNRFVGDTAKLVSGTIGGRIILLLALPVATRLYEPEDFKLLAIVMALVSLVSVVACLRLEIAIPLAENDGDAANLLVMSLISAFVISASILLLTWISTENIANWIGSPEISPYLWLVALGIFLIASYSALQGWIVRAQEFGIIARTRVSQALAGATTMLGLGWFGLVPVGLLLGNILSYGAGGMSLAKHIWTRHSGKILLVDKRSMRETLRRYSRYPVFSVPEALLNVAGMQIPILIIAAHSGADAGQLFLATQLMSAPISLVGSAVGQVYSSQAAAEYNQGNLLPFTKSIMKRLLLLGLGPMVGAAVLGPLLTPLVFGSDWQRAGEIVSLVAPWMLLQLVVSPVSIGLNVVSRQDIAMALQFSGLVLNLCAVVVALMINGRWLVEALALSGAIFYALYGWVVLRAVGKN